MTIQSLFLCHRLPFPPNKGDKIRSYALLKHLAGLGPVHLACFVDDPADLQYVEQVRKLAGGECLIIPLEKTAKWTRALQALIRGQPITTAFFGSAALSAWITDILKTRRVDNIVVFGSAMAPYVMDVSTDRSRALFDMVDVDSDKWRQYAAASGLGWRQIYRREAELLEDLERRAAAQFGQTILVSNFEAATLRTIAPESAKKISSLSNGVDLERFSLGEFPNPFPVGELPIVMTGRMDYRPNYSGAIWFADCVSGQLLQRLPTARIYFVGSNPPAQLRKRAGQTVRVTGSVDDVRPYIRHAAAVVAPLQMARGVQNKVLEAMAMGKAVVATHEATRALDVRDKEHLWIENDPQRFANAVVSAVQDPSRIAIMRNARHYVEQHHDWNKIFSLFDQYLAHLRTGNSSNIEVASSPENAAPTSMPQWRRTIEVQA